MKANVRKLAELGKGTTISYISRKKFENFQIPYPDLEIQKQIVKNIISAEEKFQLQKKQFQNIKDSYESTIKYIDYMQSAILDTAFSGKLVN